MTGPAERPYRRRILYIHKAFQRSFILKFCLIALCAMMAASMLLYFLSKNTLTATYRYHHLALQRTGEAILPALVITNLVVLLVLLAATILVTLYVSHKIGGPLYRFGKTFESVGNGNLSFQVKLREHDQLADFAAAINQMMGNLKERVMQIQHEVDLVRAKTLGEDWTREEVRRDLEGLHQKVYQLFETGAKGN
ncbi:MAG: methyl-accepting chemotaxis protein [Thermodesulfobacteriota bacterium]